MTRAVELAGWLGLAVLAGRLYSAYQPAGLGHPAELVQPTEMAQSAVFFQSAKEAESCKQIEK